MSDVGQREWCFYLTRNYLIHGYLGIDEDTLWSIIRYDVPELLPRLKALKEDVQS